MREPNAGHRTGGRPCAGMSTTCQHGPVSESVTLARAQTPHGEIALRRRGEVVELIVNGVFAMDSQEVASEIALADSAGDPPGRVLVGGLGLGYTATRLLERDADQVEIIELAEPLVRWAREGITDQLRRLTADPRVRLRHGDIAEVVAEVVAGTEEGWDAILLDVDNGPSFLVHDHNAQVYSQEFLRRCLERLNPDGAVVVWCEAPSPDLEATLGRLGTVESIDVPVRRGERTFRYTLYRARRSS